MSLNPPKTMLEFPVGKIHSRKIEKTLPADGFAALQIHAQVLGNLMVCFDATDNATIVAAGEPALLPQTIERQGDTLVVRAENMSAYLKQGQKEKILCEIHVPRQTSLDARFLGGVLILSGGQGAVNVRGKFGEVVGITDSPEVNIQLGGGDVSLNELRGCANIHVNLGSATLGWSDLVGSERVRVHCGFGAIDLVLPPGIAPVEDQGGLFKEKRVATPEGSEIYARIGFGGLDVFDWAVALPED